MTVSEEESAGVSWGERSCRMEAGIMETTLTSQMSRLDGAVIWKFHDNYVFVFLKRCPGRGANLGSFGFRLFSLSKAAPQTTRLLRPPLMTMYVLPDPFDSLKQINTRDLKYLDRTKRKKSASPNARVQTLIGVESWQCPLSPIHSKLANASPPGPWRFS